MNFSEGVRLFKLGNDKGEKQFLKYIEDTKSMNFVFSFLNTVTLEQVEIITPYVHRWTEEYRNRVLARFYKLQDWWIAQGCPPVTMMTLTTYQGDTKTTRAAVGHAVSREEALEILQVSWRKLRNMLKIRILKRNFDYVYVLENHKSGYPHMHVCIFGTLSKMEKAWVIRLWSEKYNAGSKMHGVDFSEERKDERIDTSGDGSPIRSRDDINFVGFYLIKYLGKSFSEPLEMTAGELKFSVLLWKTGARQYNCSQALAKIMKLDENPNPCLKCVGVRLEGPSIDKEFYELPQAEYRELVKSAYGKLMKELEKLGVIDGI